MSSPFLRLLRRQTTTPSTSTTVSCSPSWLFFQSASISSSNPSSKKLPFSPARTRFAPSPTGYLHLGSLRTALFNYLLAKSTGGQFLVRIEDTDQKRTVPDAEDRLCRDLRWAGLQWDEGPGIGGPYGPYKQSQRTALYREHAERLLHSNHAYRCFCTPERLFQLAEQRSRLGLPTDYDRTCAHLSTAESDERASKGEAHVIRLNVPDVYPKYTDIVYGPVRDRKDRRIQALVNPAFEDPILLKSDGFPTYHLANVVDDHYMKITHVVRAAEWMPSTPKHLAMYQAFGWQPPAFAHVGLLLDQSGQKLSKRNMDTDIAHFRDELGILPEALVNFCALLGWSHGRKSDVMSLQDLVDNFSMKFTTGNSVVTLDKLFFLQKATAARYASVAKNGDVAKLDLLTMPILDDLASLKTVPSEDTLSGRSTKAYVEQLLTSAPSAARAYTNARGFVKAHRYFWETPTAKDLTDGFLESTSSNLPRQVLDIIEEQPLPDLYNAINSVKQWTIPELKDMLADLTQCSVNSTMTLVAEYIATVDDEGELLMKNVSRAWATRISNYLRWALLAGMSGPSSAEILSVLGARESCRRLDFARKVAISKKSAVDANEAVGSAA